MSGTLPTRRSPRTKAMWAAHAAAEAAGLDIGPEQLERVVAVAIGAYLGTVADHNDIVTGDRSDPIMGDGGTTVQRPIYPEDLRRMADQLDDDAGDVVGPRPAHLDGNDRDRGKGWRDFIPME